MAAGSDSHGDYNYRRKGTPCIARWCDFPVTDTALGSPRNLVAMSGARLPTGNLGTVLGIANNDGPIRFTNQQVIGALKAGRFAVTDGPAIRLVIDRNNNGLVDDADLPMGSTFEYYPNEHIPVIVEWLSTREFGPVTDIQLFIGNKDKTFAAASVTPRNGGSGYAHDPSGALDVSLADELHGALSGKDTNIIYHGTARLMLSPAQFQLASADGALSYIRAKLTTIRGTNYGYCPPAVTAGSRCGGRRAFTNPIWARFHATCPATSGGHGVFGIPLGLVPPFVDANGNGRADSCEAGYVDPCLPKKVEPADNSRDDGLHLPGLPATMYFPQTCRTIAVGR
jgi:hypothetical protein